MLIRDFMVIWYFLCVGSIGFRWLFGVMRLLDFFAGLRLLGLLGLLRLLDFFAGLRLLGLLGLLRLLECLHN
jgi:hypothetical protein